jgi:rhodanese-related sulfurtransferase
MSSSSLRAPAGLVVVVAVSALVVVLLAAFEWLRRKTPLRDLGPTDLEARLRQGDVALVDVRTEMEFRRGHLPGALSAPLGTVLDHLDEIPRDRDVVLICQTAHRSVVAARTLADRGYDRLYHLVPGMRGWRGAVEREGLEA